MGQRIHGEKEEESQKAWRGVSEFISRGYNHLEQRDEIHFRDWRLSIEAFRGAPPPHFTL